MKFYIASVLLVAAIAVADDKLGPSKKDKRQYQGELFYPHGDWTRNFDNRPPGYEEQTSVATPNNPEELQPLEDPRYHDDHSRLEPDEPVGPGPSKGYRSEFQGEYEIPEDFRNPDKHGQQDPPYEHSQSESVPRYNPIHTNGAEAIEYGQRLKPKKQGGLLPGSNQHQEVEYPRSEPKEQYLHKLDVSSYKSEGGEVPQYDPKLPTNPSQPEQDVYQTDAPSYAPTSKVNEAYPIAEPVRPQEDAYNVNKKEQELDENYQPQPPSHDNAYPNRIPSAPEGYPEIPYNRYEQPQQYRSSEVGISPPGSYQDIEETTPYPPTAYSLTPRPSTDSPYSSPSYPGYDKSQVESKTENPRFYSPKPYEALKNNYPATPAPGPQSGYPTVVTTPAYPTDIDPYEAIGFEFKKEQNKEYEKTSNFDVSYPQKQPVRYETPNEETYEEKKHQEKPYPSYFGPENHGSSNALERPTEIPETDFFAPDERFKSSEPNDYKPFNPHSGEQLLTTEKNYQDFSKNFQHNIYLDNDDDSWGQNKQPYKIHPKYESNEKQELDYPARAYNEQEKQYNSPPPQQYPKDERPSSAPYTTTAAPYVPTTASYKTNEGPYHFQAGVSYNSVNPGPYVPSTPVPYEDEAYKQSTLILYNTQSPYPDGVSNRAPSKPETPAHYERSTAPPYAPPTTAPKTIYTDAPRVPDYAPPAVGPYSPPAAPSYEAKEYVPSTASPYVSTPPKYSPQTALPYGQESVAPYAAPIEKDAYERPKFATKVPVYAPASNDLYNHPTAPSYAPPTEPPTYPPSAAVPYSGKTAASYTTTYPKSPSYPKTSVKEEISRPQEIVKNSYKEPVKNNYAHSTAVALYPTIPVTESPKVPIYKPVTVPYSGPKTEYATTPVPYNKIPDTKKQPLGAPQNTISTGQKNYPNNPTKQENSAIIKHRPTNPSYPSKQVSPVAYNPAPQQVYAPAAPVYAAPPAPVYRPAPAPQPIYAPVAPAAQPVYAPVATPVQQPAYVPAAPVQQVVQVPAIQQPVYAAPVPRPTAAPVIVPSYSPQPQPAVAPVSNALPQALPVEQAQFAAPQLTVQQQPAVSPISNTVVAPPVQAANDSQWAFGSIPYVIEKLGLNALNDLVILAGLDPVLEKEGPFTVFVPTDKAFEFLTAKFGGQEAALAQFEKDPEGLKSLLKHHMVPNLIPSLAVTNNFLLQSVVGSPLRFKVTEAEDNDWKPIKVVTVNGARILKTDIKATNGIVHIIDRVMFPIPQADVYSTLKGDPQKRFTLLTAAIENSGLVQTLADPRGGPFTIFAPTDKAFKLVNKLELNKLLSNRVALSQLLMQHVVQDAIFTAGLQSYQNPVSLAGQPLNLYHMKGATKVNGANVVEPDIPAVNGVIHIIDAVLGL